MKTKIIISVIVIILISFKINAQTVCPNIGFETGTFANWKGYTGNCCPVVVNTPGIVPGRHTITSGNGTDPQTNFNVKIVAPGSNYSCKLGNELNGSEAERLTYTLRVTPESELFVYQYAVVLEDPGHPDEFQPRFEIKIVDSLGNRIDTICGYYKVIASGFIPGFQSFNDVRYKDWTTVGMDLTPYLGQKITIEFITADCGYGAHFGYAYIDAACSPLKIFTDFCEESDSVVLTAPPGFSYSWNPGGATTQSITLSTNNINILYTCTLTSVTNCDVVLEAVIKPTIIDPGFVWSDTCYMFSFTDTSVIENGIIQYWNWDFGDPGSGANNSSTLQNPTHTFTQNGTYTVTLIVSTINGCADTISKQVIVNVPIPHADFIPEPAITLLKYATISFFDRSVNAASWLWNFDDPSSGADNYSSLKNPVHTYKFAGTYNVKLKIYSFNNCHEDSVNKEVIVVDLVIPNVFTPNADGTNETFVITNLEKFPWNHIMIYNRWGRKVFETDNYKNDWKAEDVSDGVYYYILTLSERDEFHGTVTVIR